ncbi:uncharacterized protein LOC143552671 [Bidens hawaiensis]|uniref:uncharacterized protein LOC143552671 n=1 Tax=Bidens hawaiensis TaxID=980011 RepID=UPI00404A0A10
MKRIRMQEVWVISNRAVVHRDLIKEAVNPLVELMKNNPSRTASRYKRPSQSKNETVQSKRETKKETEKKESEKKESGKKEEVSANSSIAENELPIKTKKPKFQEGCDIKVFKVYIPKEFHGDKGAIVTLRWLEDMESIVIISKCSETEKVQYTSQMFKGEALEWWNTLIEVKGRDNLYHLEWKVFKEMILKRLCPINEIDQIQTKLWNHRVIGTNLKEYNSKFLEYFRIVTHLVTPEFNKVTRYIYGLPIEIRDLVRSQMLSTIESAVELAVYLMDANTNTCNFCKKPGHVEADCKRKTVVCFDCGEKGHFSTECPKKKPVITTAGASGSGVRTEGRKGNAQVFMLDTQKAADIPNMITGTFPINNIYARVLFDSGANQSFIDHEFFSLLNTPLVKLNDHLEVETGFDVVLGMDWLVMNQDRILCSDKTIEIRAPNSKIIRIIGNKEAGKVGIISKIKASRCLGKGCLAFMAFVTKESESKKLEEVSVVSEFKDVYPDELPGIPSDREVEFKIDLIPGNSPIAKSPYRLAPTEMKELKKQLDEL